MLPTHGARSTARTAEALLERTGRAAQAATCTLPPFASCLSSSCPGVAPDRVSSCLMFQPSCMPSSCPELLRSQLLCRVKMYWGCGLQGLQGQNHLEKKIFFPGTIFSHSISMTSIFLLKSPCIFPQTFFQWYYPFLPFLSFPLSFLLFL